MFRFTRECPGQLSSMPWVARGRVVSCANKPVGVPSCWARPAQPPHRAPPNSISAVAFGFRPRVVFFASIQELVELCDSIMLDRKPGHTSGRSGRATHCSATGLVGPCMFVLAKHNRRSCLPARARKTNVLNRYSDYERGKSLDYSWNNKNLHSSRRLPAGRESLCGPGC